MGLNESAAGPISAAWGGYQIGVDDGHPDITPIKRPDATHAINLVWSCWAATRGPWEDHTPGLWARIEQSFRGEDGPMWVETVPSREPRRGELAVYRGSINGHFSSLWGTPEEIGARVGASADAAFRSQLPCSSFTSAPGLDRSFTIAARDFPVLMRRVAVEEEGLLRWDKTERRIFERYYKPKRRRRRRR
jgi:hypothetical protein